MDELERRNKELRERFGIESFPTLVLIDANRKESSRLGQVEGGPDAWIKKAEAQMKRRPRGAPATGAPHAGKPGDRFGRRPASRGPIAAGLPLTRTIAPTYDSFRLGSRDAFRRDLARPGQGVAP